MLITPQELSDQINGLFNSNKTNIGDKYVNKVLTFFMAVQAAAVIGLGFLGVSQGEQINRLITVVSEMTTINAGQQKADNKEFYRPSFSTPEGAAADVALIKSELVSAVREALKNDLENAVTQTLETAMMDILEPVNQPQNRTLPAGVTSSDNHASFNTVQSVVSNSISNASIDYESSQEIRGLWPQLTSEQQEVILDKIVTAVNSGGLQINGDTFIW